MILEQQNNTSSTTDSELAPVITIDGPGGSGKGTISLSLAKTLGWHFLDSGALYRVLAFSAIRQNIALENEKELESLAKKLDIRFDDNIYLEGRQINDEIRTEIIGNAASKIAVYPAVRSALLSWQRAYRTFPGLVADGRDMGTIVFPDAILKIFLMASPKERAKRRYFQLKNCGVDVNLTDLLHEIQERDKRDQERVVAPLRPAEDAVVLDTTSLGIESVFELVMKEVKRCFAIKF